MAEEKQEINDEYLKECTNSIVGGKTVRAIKGLSNAEMEAMYAKGVDYYKVGAYAEALKIFKFLMFLEHTSSRYWTATGSAFQALKQYDQAIKCYQMGTFFDLHNPKPAYYAAECFLATDDRENAERALNTLDKYAPKNTEAGRRYLAKGEALRAKVKAA